MMLPLLRLEPAMEHCVYTNSDSYQNFVVIPERDRRTTRKKWCGLRMRPRFELRGCHISLCWTVLIVVFLVILCCPSHAMPIPEKSEKGSGGREKRYIFGDNVDRYLMDFGYLPESDLETGNLRTYEQLKNAIMDLQTYGNIPVTGELDKATLQLMKKPRCGMPDIASNQFRSKRYALHGQRWHYTNLTWSLRTMYPRGLDPHVVRAVLREALEVWSQNSKLTFREVNDNQADILVYFEKGYHGDGYPFDGPGQILAHAFFPGGGRGGDAHFDEEETWLLNGEETNEGTSLFSVAAHEFGHSLGLSHSSVAGALMFPWYQGWEPNFQLPDDDRNGIQQLYGPKDDRLWAVNPPYQQPPYYPEEPRRPQPPPEPPRRYPPAPAPTEPPRRYPPAPPPREPPRRPQVPVTEEPPRRYPEEPPRRYPEEPPRRYPEEPPRRYPPAPAPTEPPRRYPYRPTVSPHIPQPVPPATTKPRKPHMKSGKPDTCDTSYDAISVIRREVFIFRGRYIWRIGENGLYAGYPAETHLMWPDLPKNYTHIDAVYERGDKKIVFFIGNKYYLYNGNELQRGFPRPITHLGLPETLDKIDGAMVWGHNGKTYLFSGTMYWKFDEDVGKVELDYPRDMSMWKGVPYNIDTVFQWKDGKTYFFKGKGFWKFNDLKMRVENENPTLSAPFWMGCPRELESPKLPNNRMPEKEMLDVQPAASLSSTISICSVAILLALLLHCIISKNP